MNTPKTPKTPKTREEIFQLAKEGPVVVDFWATWCRPCKELMPKLEKVASEFPQVSFIKIEIDENPEVAQEFNIQSVPTVFTLKNGEQVDTFQSQVSEAQIRNYFQKIIA